MPRKSNALAAAAPATLTRVFDETLRLNPGIQAYFQYLIAKNIRGFSSLFDGTGQACEKETIVWQTVACMAKSGLPYNSLKLAKDGGGGLVQNRTALQWLIDEQYVIVNTDETKIALTDKMVAKLYDYCPPQKGQPTVSFIAAAGGGDQPALLPGG